MRISRIYTLALASALVTMLAALPAYAQATDTAAERARLANERIQLEAQRRAEEERRRREREALESESLESESLESEDLDSEDSESENRESVAPAQAADPTPARPPPRPRAAPAASGTVRAPAAISPPPADDDRISRALEQLRELGELRDAGYVTDEEFERIKTRILDSRF
jgi:hypothetical protein